MRVLLAALTLASLLTPTATADGTGLQLFNVQVLGQPTSGSVTLLLSKQANDAEPYVVWTDIACGQYVAASAFYRRPVTFDSARAALNRVYARFEQPGSSESPIRGWRVADRRLVPGGKQNEVLAVQLANADDEAVRITYILGRGKSCPPSDK